MGKQLKWFESAFDQDYLKRYSHRGQPQADAEVLTVLKELKPDADCKILDACCGQGRHLRAFINEGYKAYGFDLSKDLLALSDSPVARSDQRSWPFASASFDLIAVMFTSIGYFDDDSENEMIFDEMARVLKPGGTFVLDTVNPEALKKTLIPETDKNLEHGRLIEKRWIKGNRVFKDVHWETKTGIKQYQESVRLFEKEELLCLFLERDLEIDKVDTGFTKEDNSRFIFYGHKS